MRTKKNAIALCLRRFAAEYSGVTGGCMFDGAGEIDRLEAENAQLRAQLGAALEDSADMDFLSGQGRILKNSAGWNAWTAPLHQAICTDKDPRVAIRAARNATEGKP